MPVAGLIETIVAEYEIDEWVIVRNVPDQYVPVRSLDNGHIRRRVNFRRLVGLREAMSEVVDSCLKQHVLLSIVLNRKKCTAHDANICYRIRVPVRPVVFVPGVNQPLGEDILEHRRAKVPVGNLVELQDNSG